MKTFKKSIHTDSFSCQLPRHVGNSKVFKSFCDQYRIHSSLLPKPVANGENMVNLRFDGAVQEGMIGPEDGEW